MIILKRFIFITAYSVALHISAIYIHLVEFYEISANFLSSKFYGLDPVYDYIIVGCGSAGSITALRLSEEKNATVLVLEAGPILDSPWLNIPALGVLLQLSSLDWKYSTVTQQHAAKALINQASKWPMGRILGGSGRLNNLLYLRGHPQDFKNWFQEPYNYESDILTYFKKSEDHRGRYKNDSKYHSTGGPLIVEDLLFTSPLSSTFLEAAESLGFPIIDLNSQYNTGTGFMKPQIHIKSGKRWKPAHHLLTLNRPNLIIQSNSFVNKILFKSDYEAYGVELTHLWTKSSVRARKAVILSAGTIGTPKLLMLSGIGIKEHLSRVGIRTKVDLPVGNNLQDHLTTGADLILLNTSLGTNIWDVGSPTALLNYFYYGSDLWTSTGIDALGVINTKCLNSSLFYDINCQDEEPPDLELIAIPGGACSDGGVHFLNAGGYSPIIWKNYMKPLIEQIPISILPIVLHPKSRGTVRLLDNNPFSYPLIDPKYLSDSYDISIILKGIEIIKKIILTKPMQRLGARLNTKPFPGCENFKFDTKDYWECYVRHLTLTMYHPIGTCKLGDYTDKSTVVGYDFRVHKTNKLYIGDASVMPYLVSAHPNAAVMMIGEKVSEQIKYHNFLNSGYCYLSDYFIPKNICRVLKYK